MRSLTITYNTSKMLYGTGNLELALRSGMQATRKCSLSFAYTCYGFALWSKMSLSQFRINDSIFWADVLGAVLVMTGCNCQLSTNDSCQYIIANSPSKYLAGSYTFSKAIADFLRVIHAIQASLHFTDSLQASVLLVGIYCVPVRLSKAPACATREFLAHLGIFCL